MLHFYGYIENTFIRSAPKRSVSFRDLIDLATVCIYYCQRRQRPANMAVIRFVKRRIGIVGVILIATTLWIFYLIVSAPAASGK